MSTHRIDRVLRLRHNARYQAKIFAEGSHPAISSKLTNGRPSSVALRRSARSISFTGSRSHEEPSGSLSSNWTSMTGSPSRFSSKRAFASRTLKPVVDQPFANSMNLTTAASSGSDTAHRGSPCCEAPPRSLGMAPSFVGWVRAEGGLAGRALRAWTGRRCRSRRPTHAERETPPQWPTRKEPLRGSILERPLCKAFNCGQRSCDRLTSKQTAATGSIEGGPPIGAKPINTGPSRRNLARKRPSAPCPKRSGVRSAYFFLACLAFFFAFAFFFATLALGQPVTAIGTLAL